MCKHTEDLNSSAIGLSTWDTGNVCSSGMNEIHWKAVRDFEIP